MVTNQLAILSPTDDGYTSGSDASSEDDSIYDAMSESQTTVVEMGDVILHEVQVHNDNDGRSFTTL